MFALGALVFWQYRHKGESFLFGLRAFWRHPIWWVITVHFFIVLLGGYYSDDTEFWLSRLRLKTPFLLLPMAFFLLPRIAQRTYHLLFYQLLLVMTLSAIPVLVHLVINLGEFKMLLLQGQHLPLPGNHIRYSLLISMACVAGVRLWQLGFICKYRWEPMVQLGCSILLFCFSHLVAVRSGLVTLYLSLLVLVILHFMEYRGRISLLIALAILLIAPIASYLTLPSIKHKIAYTLEDLDNVQHGVWNAYSDAERLISIKGGLELARRNPLLGVGSGDLRREMRQYFLTEHNAGHYLLPHNQYISLLAGAGIVGLLLFLIAVGWPVYRCRDDAFLLLFSVIVLTSMLVENTLESSMGIALYIFYLCAGLNVHRAVPVWSDP